MDNEILKLCYTPPIATDLGKCFLPGDSGPWNAGRGGVAGSFWDLENPESWAYGPPSQQVYASLFQIDSLPHNIFTISTVAAKTGNFQS